MKKFVSVALIACAMLCSCQNGYTGKCNLKTQKDSVSYSLGMFIALGMQQQLASFPLNGVDTLALAKALANVTPNEQYSQMAKAQLLGPDSIDVEKFRCGIFQALTKGGKTAISIEAAEMVCNNAAQAKRIEKEVEQKKAGLENIAKGEAFMKKYAENDSVESLPCGVIYKVLAKGNGKKPGLKDRVKCHYHGTTVDGEVFDSSVERGEPATFGLEQVIKGWTEVLQQMRVGDKWQVVIPDSLAYGDRSAGDKIGPNSTLVFDIELLEIVK